MRNALCKSTALNAVALASVAFIGMAQPAWGAYEPPFPGQPPASEVLNLPGNTRSQMDLCNQEGPNGWPQAGSTWSCTQGIGWGTSIAYMPPGSKNEQGYAFVADCEKPTDAASCNAIMSAAANSMNTLAAWFVSNGYPGVVTWNGLQSLNFCQYCFGGPGSGGITTPKLGPLYVKAATQGTQTTGDVEVDLINQQGAVGRNDVVSYSNNAACLSDFKIVLQEAQQIYAEIKAAVTSRGYYVPHNLQPPAGYYGPYSSVTLLNPDSVCGNNYYR